jgi:hypothetical protein
MQTTDPRLDALPRRREERESMAAQKMSVPAWAVGVLVSLLSAGASAAVTYGIGVGRINTLERDVASAIVRIDRSEAARSETERTLAVVVTRLDAIVATQREQSADLRAVRESVDALRTTRSR